MHIQVTHEHLIALSQVNGRDVRQATHQQAVQWLVSQQGDIELVVRHVPQPPGLKVKQRVTQLYHVQLHVLYYIVCVFQS